MMRLLRLASILHSCLVFSVSLSILTDFAHFCLYYPFLHNKHKSTHFSILLAFSWLLFGKIPGRKAYLLENKQVLSVGVFDEVSFYTLFRALGWHLEEIHVTWAHLEKKWTRLRLYTISFEETVHTEREDSIMITKRCRQDFHIDGITDLVAASEHS
ncbi:hypothetical protein Tco_0095819 [Tanacetum coccineum]